MIKKTLENIQIVVINRKYACKSLGLKSFLANSLRIALVKSKASGIKKKLISKYRQLYLDINSEKDIENVSRFNRQDHLTEELAIEESIISDVLLQPDSQIKDEVIEEIKQTSIEELTPEDHQKADIEVLPPGSILKRIIVREGLIVEKIYKTTKGINISVFL